MTEHTEQNTHSTLESLAEQIEWNLHLGSGGDHTNWGRDGVQCQLAIADRTRLMQDIMSSNSPTMIPDQLAIRAAMSYNASMDDFLEAGFVPERRSNVESVAAMMGTNLDVLVDILGPKRYKSFALSDAVVQSGNPLYHSSSSINEAWDKHRQNPDMGDVMSLLEAKHSITDKTDSRQTFIDKTLQSHGLDRTTDLNDPRWASANADWPKRYQGELAAISATPMTDTPEVSEAADRSGRSLDPTSEISTSAKAMPSEDSTRRFNLTPVYVRSRL